MNHSAELADAGISKQLPTAPGVWWILGVYVAAIIVRQIVGFSFGNYAPVIVDAQDYDRLAVGLLETGRYITESGQPSSLRPPLYPLLVAGIYLLFGIKNYLAVALVQGGLSMITMLATHQLGNRLAGPTIGLIAAGIVGFYPSLLAFNCLLLSETLFTLFVVLGVLASIELLERPGSTLWAVVLGASLGFGALTRSILWACAPVLVGALLVCSMGKLSIRFRGAAIVITVLVGILMPWSIRNSRLHETFVLVDVMGGRNVMMGNYEYTPLERSWATISDVRGEKAWHQVLAKANPSEGGLTQGQLDKRAMRYGVSYFFAHPLVSLQRCAVRFFNFWQLDRTIVAGVRGGLWGTLPTAAVLAMVVVFCGSYALVALSALYGAFAAPFGWRQQIVLLLWVALPCAIHTIAFAHSRYHLPVIPILALYSAVTFRGLVAGDFASLRKSLIPGTLLSLILIAAWLRELVMVDFDLI